MVTLGGTFTLNEVSDKVTLYRLLFSFYARAARASPPVSHLLFPDDSLFFCKAEPRECNEVLSILRTYGKASGQCINFDKSSLLFGKRIPEPTKIEIKEVLGIENEGGMGTYLGIPEDIIGSKCKLFAFIKDRLQNRVNGWSSKLLSKGGKEILIKSVLLALPTYVMSSFLLPLDICDKLSSDIAKFWWRSDQSRNGIHWSKWDNLCSPRSEGGLGFRAIHEFNLALLAKQFWRLLRFPDSLLDRVMRGKYYKYSTPLRQVPSDNPSYGWTSILAAKPLIQLGISHKIHSGLNTRAWEDPWIPTKPARPARALAPVVHPTTIVRDFISKDTLSWDIDGLNAYIMPEGIPLIRRLAISQTFHEDRFLWSFTKSGNYMVKSGNWVARNILNQKLNRPLLEPSVNLLKAQVWKIPAPHKIGHLIWQILSDHIVVARNILHRVIRCNDVCSRCGEPKESVNHAIFECPQAAQMWNMASTPSPGETFPTSALFSNLDFLFWRQSEHRNLEPIEDPFPWVIWFIWKARNDILFCGILHTPEAIIRHAVSECHAWFQANGSTDPNLLNRESSRCPNIPIQDIFLVDGSWHAEHQHSGLGWSLFDSNGRRCLLGIRNLYRRISPLHSEIKAHLWAMISVLPHSSIQAFGTDCQDLLKMIKEPEEWPSFATELSEFARLQSFFHAFSLVYVPRSLNSSADSLAKLACSLPIVVSYVGCSVPGWISTPTQT